MLILRPETEFLNAPIMPERPAAIADVLLSLYIFAMQQEIFSIQLIKYIFSIGYTKSININASFGRKGSRK
jgi:hypothetical protein